MRQLMRWAVLLLFLMPHVTQGAGNESVTPLQAPTANASSYAIGRTFDNSEDAARYARMFQPFVVSGGLHGLSVTATTLTFATEAFDNIGNRVVQEAVQINYAALGCVAASDTGWVIITSRTENNLAQFVRVPGTDYMVDCTSTLQPALPPGGAAWLMRVTFAGGGITAVADLRSDQPVRGLPINAASPLFGGLVGDTSMDPLSPPGTDNTITLQTAINNALHSRNRQLHIPMAAPGHCYAFTRLYFNYDPIHNPNAPQDANLQGRLIVSGDGHLTERDVMTGLQRFATGTCLRSTHAEGPALNLITPDPLVVQTATQRVDFRDLHAQAMNTTAVILVENNSHIRWDNVSVWQAGVDGRGVQLRDTFQFEWHGGMVLGPGYTGATASQRPGVLITFVNIPMAGNTEFSQVTSRNWQTCWQFGLPVDPPDPGNFNTQVSLVYRQIQYKGCQNGMMFFAQALALTVEQSYGEEYVQQGITLSGHNRAITIKGNHFGGGDLVPEAASLNVGIQAVAGGPLSAGAVEVRGNNFGNVTAGTYGIQRFIHTGEDIGVELSYNNFIGPGTYIKMASTLTNQYDLRVQGNNYGSGTVMVAETPSGRPDFFGAKDYSRTGRMIQAYIAARINMSGTGTSAGAGATLTFLNSGNMQRIQATDAPLFVSNIATTDQAGNPISPGTEIKIFREGTSQPVHFVPGGNILLAAADPVGAPGIPGQQSLALKAQLICFVLYEQWQQSCNVVKTPGI